MASDRPVLTSLMTLRMRLHRWTQGGAVACRSIALCCLFLMAGDLAAQSSFSDSSRLSDNEFLQTHIKNISSQDLFRAIDLTTPGLSRAGRYVAAKDYRAAFSAWGDYWTTKRQPHYIRRTYRLLIDTEILVPQDSIPPFMNRNPEQADTIMARARQILRNTIRVWGNTIVDFGSEVDFNRDLGRSGKYGFHYWLWAHPLNTAYVLTGDTTFVRKFEELFNRWYQQRNLITSGFQNLDVVYYELGLGVRNRIFLDFYLLPFTHLRTETHERLLKTFLAAGRWLYELERWEGYRPGNWQIHGAYMLTQLGLALPEFKESRQWVQMGLQRMQEHMERDFLADGGHSERCPRNYTLATYLSYRNLYYLLTAYDAHQRMAGEIRTTMGKTIDWWLAMLAPTGEIPAFNDSHRGLFPVGILEDAAAFFGKPEVYGVLKRLFAIPHPGDSLLPPFTSRHMPASGFTVMRTDWSPDALTMTLSYGPFSGFHTHADVLGFELYGYGRALAVDAGIGMTYDDTLYVPWYKSSRAHNMVVVNDANIDRERTEGKDIVWASTPSIEYFAGDHDGYAGLGIHCRREVAFVRPSYWFVLDKITAGRAGDTLSWYVHSPTTLIPGSDGARSTTAPGILVKTVGDDVVVRSGQGWAASTTDTSPGATELIDWIRLDQITGRDSVYHFPVLLFPFREENPSVRVSRVSERSYRVVNGERADLLIFPNGEYEDHGIATDGDLLVLRSEHNHPRSFSVTHATYVRYEGREIWHSAARMSTDGKFPE
jgi:hypothetical protein